MSRRIPSKAIHSGWNPDYPENGWEDDRYVRCWNCGFVCHLDRDSRDVKGSHAQDGIRHPSAAGYDESGVTYDGTDDDWDGTVSYDGHRNDFRVDQGCPFCGCLHYDNK